MFKIGLLALSATTVSALQLESGLQAEIRALVEAEAEQFARQDLAPCLFPDDVEFKSRAYVSQSASCKKRQIWTKIEADKRINRWFDGADFLPLFIQDMNLSFDHVGDAMPIGRTKMTHPRGVHMKVAFKPTTENFYTGIFRGAKHGIMRISESVRTMTSVPQTSPGFGLKWFRDGRPSADTVAMFSFDG